MMGSVQKVCGALATTTAVGLTGAAAAQSLGEFSAGSGAFLEPWAASSLGQTETDTGGDDGFTVFANNPEGYSGAQGLISLQGTRGTFLNPTSGTLAKGQVTLQYCILLADQEAPNSDITGHGVLGSYGVTDWLEVGFFHNAAEVRALNEIISVTGPTVRARVLQETDVLPEVSVGGLWYDGDRTSDGLSRQEIYVVASKQFVIDDDGWLQSARVHGGIRQVWKHDSPAATPDNGTVGHIAGELFLPYGFSFIGEVNVQDDTFGPRTPFAYGVQFKPVDGILGLSIAQVQNGGLNRQALYIGIGGVLEF